MWLKRETILWLSVYLSFDMWKKYLFRFQILYQAIVQYNSKTLLEAYFFCCLLLHNPFELIWNHVVFAWVFWFYPWSTFDLGCLRGVVIYPLYYGKFKIQNNKTSLNRDTIETAYENTSSLIEVLVHFLITLWSI